MVFITRELGEVVHTVIAEGTADNSFTCPDPRLVSPIFYFTIYYNII